MKKIPLIAKILFICILILGIYAVIWWVAVFNGYYEHLMTSYQKRELLCYLPADILLGIMVLFAVAGIRRRKEWGFWVALLVCGGFIYALFKVIVMFFFGLLPDDILTHLIVWPYFILGLVAVPLLWKLKKQMVL